MDGSAVVELVVVGPAGSAAAMVAFGVVEGCRSVVAVAVVGLLVVEEARIRLPSCS